MQSAICSSKKEKSLAHRIANCLIHYRNARHATIESSPAQLIIGRDLRSRLHLLKPDVWGYVLSNQATQVNSRSVAPEWKFEVGDTMMVRDYRPKHQKWQPGIVQMQTGTKSYHVDVHGGTTTWRRHADQIVKTPDGMHLEQPDKGYKLWEDETVHTEEVQAPVNVEATLQNNESQST